MHRLDEAGSRVHGYVKLALVRAVVAAMDAAAEHEASPTAETTAAAGGGAAASAALGSGWSLGINFGPTVHDDQTTLATVVRASGVHGRGASTQCDLHNHHPCDQG